MASDLTKAKHKREARQAGLKLIGPGKNSSYRTYQWIECKHQAQYQLTHVRRKNIRCMSCFNKKLKSEARAAGFRLMGSGRNPQCRLYRCKECKTESEYFTSSMRDRSVRCQTCYLDQLETEAEEAGFNLLGKGSKPWNRQYQCKKCDHKQERQTPDVRVGNVACEKCFEDQLKTEAEAQGLTVVGECGQDGYRLYQFETCEHIQALQMAHVRDGVLECKECLDKRHEEEATNVGLTLLGKSSTPNLRRYQFNDCEHEKEIDPGDVRDNAFRCAICFDEKLAKEAEKVGLTILGAGKDANYRLYSFNDCGHQRELSTSAVRKSSFVCNSCEEVARDLPSHIYFVQLSMEAFSWIKVGFAKNPDDRVKRYGMPHNVEALEMVIIPQNTGRIAEQFERDLHRRYRTERLSPQKMKRYHTKSGSEECYPVSLRDTLRLELNQQATRSSSIAEVYSPERLAALLN